MIDLHTHSTFSDGELIPAELIRRARHVGYEALAITDHADAANMEFILSHVPRMTALGHFWDITVFAGVELTHMPPGLIAEYTNKARELGAQLVVVHGETVVEPVARGTNLAAIEAGVDILAHPGLITDEEVALAVEKGVALEITTRGGHSYTNGHVATLARKHGARLVIDNDAHAPRDLVSREMRRAVALGAGLTADEFDRAEANSREIVQRLLQR
ncbi:Histidinol phosphatase [Paucidesulfovibrio gracilis DSM 16080]|uniref:Histidinol phosphatase n=1 Tax=Paucidesulfovibrio gracilis DSM 16080 TaxID=1121449 RepID=A0A1T4WKE3_9BACT|nr:histidinol phosphate phosphatase domain-containing protein [Paucidesulfovibrio gracilis]SKA77637.1 Histidinol phosphatase [Paucidesulfovibrio gracilis DSM 16080]